MKRAGARMRLKTDYRDWWDYAFDLDGDFFYRMSTGGMSRREMFTFMEGIGMSVPTHGIVKNIANRLLAEFDVEDLRDIAAEHLIDLVVYINEQAHRGEGKLRMPAAEALQRFPDHYCSEFIPATQTGVGHSLRFLQVGARKWWLEYWSEDDWRSNVGEGGVKILCEAEPGYHPKVEQAMFAIDFVKAAGRLYAIDYNIAPGLAPLNGHVKASELVEELKRFQKHAVPVQAG
jgi:hypothetical protein